MITTTVRQYRSLLDIPVKHEHLIITKVADAQIYYVAKYYKSSGIEPVFTVRGRTADQAERYARQQMKLYGEIGGYPRVEVN